MDSTPSFTEASLHIEKTAALPAGERPKMPLKNFLKNIKIMLDIWNTMMYYIEVGKS